MFPLCENILSNEQYGFLPGRSSKTNLSIFKQLILESFNNKSQFDVIYTDFDKDIKCTNDALQLQCDLNSLYQWCIENYMSSSIDKCAIIYFSFKKKYITF